MTRLQSLAEQFKCNPQFDKRRAAQEGFNAGFIAARKMCSIMGQIAHLEGKSIEQEILKVGTEEAKPSKSLPAYDIPDVIINTLE